jgi:phosphatidate cytidylyltransferase
MNTFIKRTLTAVVFAVVMLGGMLWSYETFTILFFIINAGAAWEYDRLIGRFRIYNRIGVLAYRWMFTLLSSLMYISFYLTVVTETIIWVAAMPACIFIFIALELYSITERGIQNIALNIFGVLYIALPLGLLHFIIDVQQAVSNQWFPGQVNIILALLLLIWANDTFAYLGGSLMGKHKLFPTHSPKKSWEGFFTGMAGALLSAYFIHLWLLNDHDLILPFMMAVIAAVIGTAGDLFESMIKRNAGVKDSGSIMPGHGGFLDRFDAFLFVVPFVFILLLIINY